LRTFCEIHNFRRLLRGPACPQTLRRHLPDLEHYLGIEKDVKPVVKAQYELDTEIFTAFSALVGSEGQTNTMLMPRCAQRLPMHNIGGMQYMDYMTSDQNSSVYIQMDADGGALVPARIRAIFSHRRRLLDSHGGKVAEEVFMVINAYLPLDKGKEDLFISFPDFGAACFSRHVDKSIRVIRSSQVKCHAICRPWGESTVVLRPLNRVCPNPIYTIFLLTAYSRTVIAQRHIPQRRDLAL
jgi:hypothetical protein